MERILTFLDVIFMRSMHFSTDLKILDVIFMRSLYIWALLGVFGRDFNEIVALLAPFQCFGAFFIRRCILGTSSSL